MCWFAEELERNILELNAPGDSGVLLLHCEAEEGPVDDSLDLETLIQSGADESVYSEGETDELRIHKAMLGARADRWEHRGGLYYLLTVCYWRCLAAVDLCVATI